MALIKRELSKKEIKEQKIKNELNEAVAELATQKTRKKKKHRKLDLTQELQVNETETYCVQNDLENSSIYPGTYIVSINENGDQLIKKISPTPILLIKKVEAKGKRYIKASYLKEAGSEESEILICIDDLAKKNKQYFYEKLLISETNQRTNFAQALISIYLYSNMPKETLNYNIQSGFDEEHEKFLTPENHALMSNVMPHICIKNDEDEEEKAKILNCQNLFTNLASRNPLLKQMVTAAVSGFLMRLSGYQNNPIFWFWERDGHAGKSLNASLVNVAFLHSSSLQAAYSTKVGIERLAYSANDSFIFLDEAQQFANGVPQLIANMIQTTAIGGGRVKASDSEEFSEYYYNLSAIFLANTSATELFEGTTQEVPILSRIVEWEVKKEIEEDELRELQISINKANVEFKKNPGFYSKDVIDYIIENKKIIFDVIQSKYDFLKNQVGKTSLNGRNLDGLTLFYVASQILEKVYNLKAYTDKEMTDFALAYKKTDEDTANDIFQTLNQAYNLLFKNIKINGYYAARDYDLIDSFDENNNTITAEQKQIDRAQEISCQNQKNGFLGMVYNEKNIATHNLHNLHDFDLLGFTSNGKRTLAKLGCNLDATINFCIEKDLLNINDEKRQSKHLKHRDKDVGYTVCFDLKKIEAFLRREQQKLKREDIDDVYIPF